MNRARHRSGSKNNLLATGCLKLVAKIGCVAYAISKIAMGGKYRSDCPVQELVPISIILSGVFQFFLCAFTCEKNGNQSKDDREAFKRKCRLSICCLATIVNVGILVTCTVAVSMTLQKVKFAHQSCFSISDMANETTSKVVISSNQNRTANGHGYTSMKATTSPPSLSTRPVHMKHAVNSSNNTGQDTLDNYNIDVALESRTCVLCKDTILVFVTVAVSIDWFIAIVGTVFLCFLRFHINKKQ